MAPGRPKACNKRVPTVNLKTPTILNSPKPQTLNTSIKLTPQTKSTLGPTLLGFFLQEPSAAGVPHRGRRGKGFEDCSGSVQFVIRIRILGSGFIGFGTLVVPLAYRVCTFDERTSLGFTHLAFRHLKFRMFESGV